MQHHTGMILGSGIQRSATFESEDLPRQLQLLLRVFQIRQDNMKRSLLWAALLAVPTVAASEDIADTDTVIVTSTRYEQPLSSALSPVVVITGEEIRRMQATSFADIVRTLPGIQVSMNGGRGQQTKAQIRGGNATDTLFLVNGVKLNTPYDGATYLERIPVSQIERIEYIRGVRASVYGSQASAAVINIITRPGFDESQILARASYGTHRNRKGSVSFKQAIGDNGELKLAAGTEKERGYNVHPVPGQNDGDRHGFQGTSFMADYQHRLGPVTIFGDVSWLKTKSQFDTSSDDPMWGSYHEYDMNQYENWAVELGGRYSGDIYRTGLSLNLQRTDDFEQIQLNPFREGKTDNTPIYLRTLGLEWTNELALADIFTLGGGLEIRQDRILKKSKVYYEHLNPEHPKINNTGAYLLGQVDVEGFQAELAGRYDHSNQYGAHFTYQGGLGLRFFDDYKASIRFGTSFRAPTFMELYYPYMGSHDLKPETSDSLEAMIQGEHKFLNWRISLFNNHYRDRIVYYYETYSFKNISHASVSGIEAEFGFEVAGVKNTFSAGYRDPRDRTNHTDIPYVSPRDFKWNLSGRVGDFDLSASFLAFSSRSAGAGARRLGGYGLLNLGVGYSITDNFKIQAKADNILDKRYETARGFPCPEATFTAGFEFSY